MILIGGYMGAKATNEKTGEIVEEPAFVKTYIDALCSVRGLGQTQTNIFHFFLKRMDENNEVSYGPKAKARFLTDHGLKNQSFNNAVKKLLESGLAERIGRAEFRVNKKYAVKVPWHMVQKIKWESEFSREGSVEKVSVVYVDRNSEQ